MLDAPRGSARHRRSRSARACGRRLVERSPYFVDLVRLVDADLPHEHAAVLLEADEARPFERPKRLAHGAARDAEELRHGRFVQLAAGGQVAREDHPLELFLDEPRQGARLHQRDGIGAVTRHRWRTGGGPVRPAVTAAGRTRYGVGDFSILRIQRRRV
jgi:hypothetical protein